MPTVTQYQIVFWLCLLGTVFLSLTPSIPGEQLVELQDKVGHTTIYAVLFFICARAYGHHYPLLLLAAVLAAFGAGMEAAQSMTAYRQAEVWDMVANTSGIVAVWAVMAWRRRRR